MPLVLKSVPQEGESLEGLVARLGVLNVHPGPHWILQAAKLSDGFDRRVSDLHGLEQLSGVPASSLEAMTHWPLPGQPGRLRFARHCVQMSALALYQARVCPLCVAEYGFARQLWHLKTYAVCHEHAVMLVDRCHACGWRLRWLRPALDRCRCGAQLRAGAEPPLSAAVDVARRLSEVAAAAPGPQLEDLGVLAKVIWFFGTDHGQDGWRSRFLLKPTVLAAAETAARAAPFVFEWDAAISEWLGRFLPPPSTKMASWIIEAPILLRLKTAFHQPESEYILDLVKAHLSEGWDDGLRRRSEFCAAPTGEGALVTAQKAARLLRSNPRSVKRLVAEGELEGSIQWRGARQFCVVSRVSIQAYLARNPWLGPREAAEYLGIPMQRLARIRAEKKLEIEKGGRANFYLASELDAVLRRLAPHERKLGPNYRSWANLYYHNRALDLVLAGKLRAFRDPSLGSGFRAFVFQESELRRVASNLRAALDLRRLIPARAATQRLAMNHNTLRELVAQGYLIGSFRGDRLNDLELESVRRFEKKYSTAPAYARRRKLFLRDVLYRLRFSVEQPLLKPDAATRINGVWRLATLEGLDLPRRLPPTPQFSRRRGA